MKKDIFVTKRNGKTEKLDVNKINKGVERACLGILDVSASEVLIDAHVQLFEGVSTQEIDKALIFSARSKIEEEPNYSYVAARLLLDSIYKEVFNEGTDNDTFQLQYQKSFIKNIKSLVKSKRFDVRLLDFNLPKLSKAINPIRDNLFKYVGIQNIFDRYLTKRDGKVMETPQAFWMRVAMGLSINEKDKDEKAILFYDQISQFYSCPSTPTLFNSGTVHPQLSSCFLSTTHDSIDGIFDSLWQEARKSKYAGGLGFDVTPLRASNSYIAGTNGKSSGLIPWLKLYNDMLVAVNQSGKRQGSGCAYLEPWHLDVEDFIALRKPTGEERMRCHDLNTALWIPDLFLNRVEEDGDWYLFSPNEVPELHENFGEAFNKIYIKYCNKAEKGEMLQFKKTKAKELWKTVLKSLFESSHPWITFKDPCNQRHANQHEGAVYSSNLCTEIILRSKPSNYKNGEKTEIGETAVCNLQSVNLRTHVENGAINYDKLKESVITAIRMLDNVIDINFYPTQEASNSNLKHRPIGLGEMGFHDICHMLNIRYDSVEGVALADKIQEFISYYAILASSELAKERGSYQTFEGSLWSKQVLPIDTYNSLYGKAEEGQLDWGIVKKSVKTNGMRNSHVMAIAPTATISYIQGCEQSIEPNYSVLFVYENKSGNFYISNEHFVNDMKKLGIWSKAFAQAVKQVDGDLSDLKGIPQEYKDKYRTAFDREFDFLIDAAAARQKWIDMGQSFNIYLSNSSMKSMNDIAFKCWKSGLKTTYYWRNRAASKVEKSTVNTMGEPKMCSIEDKNNGTCESCQ